MKVLCFWGRNRGEEIGARRKRADWGAFYRRAEAVEEGRTPVARLGERRGAPLMAFVVATSCSAIRGGDAMVRAARTHREDAHVEGPAAQLGVALRGSSSEAGRCAAGGIAARGLCSSSGGTAVLCGQAKTKKLWLKHGSRGLFVKVLKEQGLWVKKPGTKI